MGLGSSKVIGLSRVPSPAASTMAFIGAARYLTRWKGRAKRAEWLDGSLTG